MKKLILLIAFGVFVTAPFAQTLNTPKKGDTNPPVKPKFGIKVGDTYAGGIVFWIEQSSSPSDPHGLVCASIDQSNSIKWDQCFTSAHYLTLNGFSDWRVPNKTELNRMYFFLMKAGLGGLTAGKYWSSSSRDDESAWYQDFTSGDQDFSLGKNSKLNYRAVRSF